MNIVIFMDTDENRVAIPMENICWIRAMKDADLSEVGTTDREVHTVKGAFQFHMDTLNRILKDQ